jgi:O6-methylguanine-DNA--protein-cysteine methyltransferase
VTGGNRKAPAGGSAGPIRFGLGRTSIAALLVALGPGGVVAIIISEHPVADAQITELKRRFPDAYLVRDDQGIEAEMAPVIGFVEAPTGNLELPLDIRGTDFEQRVYREVLAIPFGQTRTFADIAAGIDSPKATPARGTPSSSQSVPPGASPRRLLGGRRRLWRSAPTHHCHPRGRSRAQAGAVCRRRPMSRAAGTEACRAPT